MIGDSYPLWMWLVGALGLTVSLLMEWQFRLELKRLQYSRELSSGRRTRNELDGER